MVAKFIFVFIHWNTAPFDGTISSTGCLFNEKIKSENGQGSKKIKNFEIFEVFQNSNFMWKMDRTVYSESKTLEIKFRTLFLTNFEKVENSAK